MVGLQGGRDQRRANQTTVKARGAVEGKLSEKDHDGGDVLRLSCRR